MGKSSTSFKKGQGGRPKGTKSKRMKQWEEFGRYVIEKGTERAMKIMEKCDDETFIEFYHKTLEYFKPKLARTELTGKDGNAMEITVTKRIVSE